MTRLQEEMPMHHHVIAHASHHIVRIVIHLLMGVALVAGIGWCLRAGHDAHVFDHAAQKYEHAVNTAGQSAAHVFEH